MEKLISKICHFAAPKFAGNQCHNLKWAGWLSLNDPLYQRRKIITHSILNTTVPHSIIN